MNRPEFAEFRKNRWVFHGTRKNTVNSLLEVGCSEARVAAIVNMSPAMVHHYSKRVSQFRLARAAMEQFEAGWEKLRPSVLGNVKVVK
jgi:predicted transcriptional regulator